MTIRYLGHACFLIISDEGTRTILDPYEPGGFSGQIGYGAFTEPVDIVVVSHDHADHNYVQGLKGNPKVLRGPQDQTVGDIPFHAVPVYHDERRGAERGVNVIRVFPVDRVRVCHVGDLGHVLTEEQVRQVGPVDVLLVPVGGVFTVDAQGATQVVEQLEPRIVIPMHYKTPKTTFPLAPVEDFLRGKPNVRRVGSSQVPVSADMLPAEREIVVLEHEL